MAGPSSIRSVSSKASSHKEHHHGKHHDKHHHDDHKDSMAITVGDETLDNAAVTLQPGTHHGENASHVSAADVSLPYQLERSNTTFVETPTPITNSHSYNSSATDLYAFRASVIPKIWLPVLVTTLWGAFWTVAYLSVGWKWIAIPNQLIGILGVVMGLLLVFRTNTAYDRYWEARRLWGTVTTQVRAIARIIWVSANVTEPKAIDFRFNAFKGTPVGAAPVKPTPEEAESMRQLLLAEKHAALNLVIAFPLAIKHHLRGEKSHKYQDIHNLLIHLPDYRPGALHPETDNMPVDISLHLTGYTTFLRRSEMVDLNTFGAINAAILALVDCLSNMERIKMTPIPKPYAVHLKQTLFLYILSLPFQLVGLMGWATIPVVFLAAFTLQGIEAIGGEIENPFGYDRNDLDIDDFCDDLKKELVQMIDRPVEFTPTVWSTPVRMGDFSKLFKLSSKPKGRESTAVSMTHVKSD
ncbi:Bestrophin, RFP-TM, chloride channel-domain-containing protein [Entophlyctis helioformis]|nr:Bestrophin, RFP-TM, chloride channel-domain-containing protein [Entophlyctis helioformis]